jgi:hypothetical protein
MPPRHDPVPVDYTVTLYSILTSGPITIGPPLKGKNWIALNGCCEPGWPHRSSPLPLNGNLVGGQLFAIDWKQTNDHGAFYTGDKTRNAAKLPAVRSSEPLEPFPVSSALQPMLRRVAQASLLMELSVCKSDQVPSPRRRVVSVQVSPRTLRIIFNARTFPRVNRLLLDRMLILHRRHRERVLAEYVVHFNQHRPHRAPNQTDHFPHLHATPSPASGSARQADTPICLGRMRWMS